MSQFVAAIDGLPVGLPQRHGLWESAYHLIHPESSIGASHESQFASFDEMGSGVKIWQNGVGTDWAHGPHVGHGLTFQSDCVGELGCWGICDENYNCQDVDAPTNVKTSECEGDETVTFHPSVITKRVSCSTFGYGHMKDHYWPRVGGKLIRGRGQELECRLAEGDCVLDENDVRANAFFAQPVLNDEAVDFEVLGNDEGEAMGYRNALAALDHSLAFCNGGQAGMIHVPAAIAGKFISDRLVAPEIVDLGDGMGPRSILRTTARGNIVVAGSGYNGIGPGAAAPEENTAWIYATSMVHLVWDNVVFSPDEGDFRSHFKDNRVDVVAEQIVGAFFDPCCNYAILADLC